MKRFLTSSLVWAVLVTIAYFATDIIDKGQTLNALTPVPILGYALWVAIILLLWALFFEPVISFFRLTCASKVGMKEQLEHALKAASAYETADVTDKRLQLYLKLSDASSRELYCTPDGCRELAPLLEEAHATFFASSKKERELIRSYSVAAGVGVVFSRNPLLDGVVLLVMQLRLVIALAKLRHCRPSPVFNLCCFLWVLSNSVVAALSQDAVEGIAEAGGDFMVEMLTDTEMFSGMTKYVPFFQNVLNLTMQAVLAGTSVYVTGHVFLGQLNREGMQLSMRYLVDLRKKGYREIGSAVVKGVMDWADKGGADVRTAPAGKEA